MSSEGSDVNFALTDEEARKRALKWRHEDPLGDKVAPSLLSQLEIEPYARQTGLIYPFDLRRLKTASYEGRIGSRALASSSRVGLVIMGFARGSQQWGIGGSLPDARDVSLTSRKSVAQNRHRSVTESGGVSRTGSAGSTR